MRNEKGITLIALIVTIIVLLILAGISLNLISGSDGILNKASKANDETLKATAKEEVEMAMSEILMQYYEDGRTENKAEYILENLKNDGSGYETANATIFPQDNELEVVAWVDSKGRTVFVTLDENQLIIDATIGTLENMLPIVNINSFTSTTVTFTVKSLTNRIVGYAVTEENEEPTSWEEINEREKKITKTGLESDKTYYIFAKDVEGKVSKSKCIVTKTLLNASGNVTASWSHWEGTIVTVEFAKHEDVPEDLQIQLSTDSINWITTNQIDVESNTTVFVRLWDGYKGGNYWSTTPIWKGKVEYNMNGGTGTIAMQKKSYNIPLTLSTNTPDARTSYIFKGWATSSTAIVAEYQPGDEYTANESVTLYAVWEFDQVYASEHPELHTPTGFSYKEGTVSTGYVITDGTNEFVWIPVASSSDYTKKLGTNNKYMKSGSTGDDTNLTLSTAIKGDYLGVSSILGKTVTNSVTASYPEASIVNSAGGFWVGRYESGTTSTASADSIDWSSETIVEKQGVQPARYITQATALSRANNWKKGSANTDKGTVAFQSGLITGTQWDVMCNFIGWDTCNSDCSSWGNYNNVVSASYTGYHSIHNSSNWEYSTNITKLGNGTNCWVFPTGKFVNSSNGTTVKKNIYDIAGNVWSWTTEKPLYNAECIVLRGGSANAHSSNHFATFRNGCRESSFLDQTIGFRLVLYVK